MGHKLGYIIIEVNLNDTTGLVASRLYPILDEQSDKQKKLFELLEKLDFDITELTKEQILMKALYQKIIKYSDKEKYKLTYNEINKNKQEILT